MKGKQLLLTGFGVGILVGCIATFLLYSPSREFSDDTERWSNNKYSFISPLLACGDHEFDHLGNDELVQFEKALESLVATQKETGKAREVGIYFRQLKGGPWLGLNEQASFTPGSLLKVPLAMSVYKLAEANPSLLDAEIVYEGGSTGVEKHFKNSSIESGQTYSVEALIEAMLTRSDNDAAVLLAKLIGSEALARSYLELGIEPPTSGNDYSTTVRGYASFFRILYNATYVSNDYSEHLLETLSHTTFKDGLVAGVPSHVPVAHKFGERSFDSEGTLQLHDCGIIYHPDRPYLLCVMTRGTNFEQLASAIQEISALVYEHVE